MDGRRLLEADTGENERSPRALSMAAIGSRRTKIAGCVVMWTLLILSLGIPSGLAAQAPSDPMRASDSISVVDSLSPGLKRKRDLPVFLVLGLGYGSRNDECVLCESPEDNKSFTGHLSLGRPLGQGFGVGLDVSVWRRGRPGTPLPADSTGVPGETSLANTLGNLSVSFSYDFWHLYLRAGGGLAFGGQDLETTDANGNPLVHTASGWGIGYSAGVGLTVPVASIVSLSFFGNWNVGLYDMISPRGLTERQARHEFMEFGAGLAIR